MTYRVVFTARARADMLEAFRYLADRSPAAAGRWHAALGRAIDRLSKGPELCPIAQDESEQLGAVLREMLFGRRPGTYRVLLSVEIGAVVLHYVRHAARGPIDT